MGLDEFLKNVNFLEPEAIEFCKDDLGRLKLKIHPDREYDNVRVVKGFPLTDVGRFLSVRDENNEEIGIIRDLEELPESVRELLMEEMERLYFIPRITRILSIKTEFGVAIWEVETDKGPRIIELRGEDSYRFLPRGRLIITDVHENYYQIEDMSALDARSRSLLDRYL